MLKLRNLFATYALGGNILVDREPVNGCIKIEQLVAMVRYGLLVM